jgi:hypothetical protein
MRAAEAPTTAAARDLSGYDVGTSAYRELTPYLDVVPFRHSLPCACGGVVTADIECPAAGVRDHQRTAMHGFWRAEEGL